MNSRIIHLAAVALMLGILTSACDRQPRKTAELQRINDSMEHPHNYADTFNADRQKWEEYKIEARARLKANEDSLKAMNQRIATASARLKTEYSQKMVALQARNAELRDRLEAYKEDGRENWERFKVTFNSDLDTVSQNMRLFFTDSKQK